MGSENSTRQPQAEARVLVLGATGGIGRWTVREAVDGGWSVRALVRKDAALDPGVEVRVGDPLDPPVVAAALEGVTGVRPRTSSNVPRARW